MRTVETGPVAAFLDALNGGDLPTVHALLADDAVLTVPSLRGTLRGRNQITGAFEAVVRAFPDLRYAVTSRYVAPGQVTDEVVLTGIRLGPWGEVPPSGRPHLLPARVVLDHDGARVTAVAVWADAAALRATVDDRSDTRDLIGMPTVTALRATIPAGDPRVILGRAREESAAPQQAAAASAAPRTTLNPASAKAAELKVPMPRRVRRALVVAASVAMAAATLGIVAWVVQGALAAPSSTVRIGLGGQGSTPSGSGTPSTAPEPAPSEKAFTREGNLITLNTDLTFAKDSAKLNQAARRGLAEVIDQVRAESRSGRITVNGYTDSDGTKAHNLELSQDRARAVARVLEKGLKDLEGIEVVWMGYGEDRPRTRNDTEAGKAQNRRVEITVPGDE